MVKSFKLLGSILLASLFISPMTLPIALAQQPTVTETEEVVVLGTRRQDGRSQTDSLVPVDVITGDDFARQGATQLDSQLANLSSPLSVYQCL